MKYALEIFRDVLILFLPSVVAGIVMRLNSQDVSGSAYELADFLGVILGGVIVGALFYREYGSASIIEYYVNKKGAFPRFIKHSIFVALLASFLSFLFGLEELQALEKIDFLPVLFGIVIAGIMNCVKLYLLMQLGSWLCMKLWKPRNKQNTLS